MLKLNTWIQTDEHQFILFDGENWNIISEEQYPVGVRRSYQIFEHERLTRDFLSKKLDLILMSYYPDATVERFIERNPNDWQQLVAEMVSENEIGDYSYFEDYLTLAEVRAEASIKSYFEVKDFFVVEYEYLYPNGFKPNGDLSTKLKIVDKEVYFYTQKEAEKFAQELYQEKRNGCIGVYHISNIDMLEALVWVKQLIGGEL